jgi:hypothetical protein
MSGLFLFPTCDAVLHDATRVGRGRIPDMTVCGRAKLFKQNGSIWHQGRRARILVRVCSDYAQQERSPLPTLRARLVAGARWAFAGHILGEHRRMVLTQVKGEDAIEPQPLFVSSRLLSEDCAQLDAHGSPPV